ncbi:sirohydrochlorin ferrochelatase [Saccharopolyspora lacisalsi]|uniref:Sirohydrochlorin ferrochelatase n=1 Tax=Halosaccharopolyspora lacisalsi TaxID=1000566 RepID=A0A839DX38_9PSEU|nr:sirohydrochlorin chelatase [Halosaccharopolyspora lacisalsi]MBA8825440.1 sirohydrochlorin ferrochelatase [Halosaccharopolyspora lacisalsi]
MSDAPLVAVAHGSRDPRSAAAIHALLNAVRAERPDLDVRTAFLDLSDPRVEDVLDAVHDHGHSEAVIVPLLLGHAFHARVDVPRVASEAERRHPGFRVRTAGVLGPDQRLAGAARDRLLQAGVDSDDPELGVILAGAGSSYAPANRLVSEVAARWERENSWAGAVAAFAAAAEPDVPAAVRTLRERGARRFAIGSWFLAPGLLPDRVIGHAHDQVRDPTIAEPMADHPRLVELVLQRYTDVDRTEDLLPGSPR